MGKDMYPAAPVLVVDDDNFMLHTYEIQLAAEGITNVLLCEDSREVIPRLSQGAVETIILDLMMPNMSGEELLEKIARDFPDIPVIIVTGVDDTDTVVRCMQSGAFDFITKPIERNRLITSLKRTLRIKELERENNSLKSGFLATGLKHPEAFSDFNTTSGQMLSIFRYMEVIAASSEPVLITGETGSGKELIAKALGKLNHNGTKFIPVNVAGLDDQLFSDTLFGHVKGAFTDASQVRKGLVEQAAGGILFLDEIGDLGMASQVKLLRLIQEHEFYPIGADVPRRSSARIIVATNKSPGELQKMENFRNDLYYRLRVYHIQLPPLRERPEDIPLLVDRFLEQAAADLGKRKPTVPDELATLLSTYHFPGNIRELRTMVYEAVSMHSTKKMSMDTFVKNIREEREKHPPMTTPGEDREDSSLPVTFGHRLPTFKEIHEVLVMEALKRSANNQSIAAGMLGITRQALNKRLRDLKAKKESH